MINELDPIQLAIILDWTRERAVHTFFRIDDPTIEPHKMATLTKKELTEEVQKQLWDYLRNNPISTKQLALKIGLSSTGLAKFMRGGTCQMKTIALMEKFLKEHSDVYMHRQSKDE